MSNELAWIESWCFENIKAAPPDNEDVASLFAQGARSAAQAAGLQLRTALVAAGYATLEDYMLDYLASRADAKDQRRGKTKPVAPLMAGGRIGPIPQAKYGFDRTEKDGQSNRVPKHRDPLASIARGRRFMPSDDSSTHGERRRGTRRRALKGGKVVLSDWTAIDCLVRNVSAQGARLEFGGPTKLPAEFRVLLESTSRLLPAELEWQRGLFAGVRFSDAVADHEGARER